MKGPVRAWTFKGSGRVWGYEPGMTVWSPPAIAAAQGRALLAVGSYDKLVYVLDAANGEVVWKVATGGPAYAAPTMWSDGSRVLLFAASTDRLVYAFDAATGRREWVHSVADWRPTIGGARLSSPVVGRAKGQHALFVGHWVFDRSLANSFQEGGLTALSAREGKPLWTVKLGDNEVTAPVFATVGGQGRLFVGSSNGNVFALDAETGEKLWSQTELDAVRSPPAFFEAPDGPRVVMGSKFGTVRCLDAVTGAARWEYRTGERITGSPAVAKVGGRLLVVVGSYDRHVHALDASTGALVWRYAAKGGVFSSPAIVADNAPPLVLASAWDHLLHAADARSGGFLWSSFTGRPLWEVGGLDDSNWSSPVAARLNGDWMAFAGSYDGTFYALPVERRAVAGDAPIRSNLAFWISFLPALAFGGGLAILLTRKSRRGTRG